MAKIENLTDRELLEKVFASQVVLMQQVYRVKDFMLTKYGGQFAEHGIHRDETFEKLEHDIDDFWRQYRGLKENNK